MNNSGMSKDKRGPWYSSCTGVFWLVDEIETGAPSSQLIYCYVRSALQRMGYLGSQMTIWAFGPKEQSLESASDITFSYEAIEDKDNRVHKMLFRIITYGACYSDEEGRSVMVITKSPPKEDDELLRVLRALETRGYDVLLVQPPHDDDEAHVFSSPDSIFKCTTFLDGSSPIDFDLPGEESSVSWETVSSDPENLDDESNTSHLSTMNNNLAMSKIKSGESNYTRVFWNMDDYPIPKDIKPRLIYKTILSALERMRCNCYKFEILSYGEKIDQDDDELDEYYEAGILYLNHNFPDNQLLREMVFGCSKSSKPLNLMVISKSIPQDKESRRILWALKSRGYNVLLVQPQPESSQELFLHDDPDLLCCSTYLLDGRKAMDQSGGASSSSSLVANTSRSNCQDFSEPITHVSGTKTGIFWDINECPFPYGLDPETIFDRIKLALEDHGVFDGVISIWAYAERIPPFSDEMLDTYHKSRIYFVPQVPGDKTARVLRMVHDTELWNLDFPVDYPQQSNLIVISNDISNQGFIGLTTFLKTMDENGYYTFLVQPVDIAQEKLTAPDWPRGILDKAFDFSKREIFKKARRKRTPL
ncbi:uncharacterized protein LOC111831097 [Capsella rubella]|uniref:uncharacterized protein LOC111831097 n=1 Tax=Capsella rubella TaxID=81985 RepID=UPI000CD54893|nr:uncharacterized protein LOC111831097 [Capsella rubella]